MLSVAFVMMLAGCDPALPLSHASSQADWNARAAHDLDVARCEMKTQLALVVDLAKSDPAQVGRVQAAQQAWEAYSTAQLDALYGCDDPRIYGSVYPMCRPLAEKAMCEHRAAELAKMTAGQEGLGAICRWVPTCSDP